MFKGVIEIAVHKKIPNGHNNETLIYITEHLPISFSGCITASNCVYNINTDA